MLPQLNLPTASIKLKEDKIWCRLRKKYYKNTPEEWVRQNFIYFLLDHKNYPEGRMVSEHLVVYNGMNKRCDIALFNDKLEVDVVIECKAPKVEITEETFFQVARYNKILKASFLILTNGMQHYCAFIDTAANEMRYLKEIPTFSELEKLKG